MAKNRQNQLEEAGFGEQNYFDAAQVWRAMNGLDFQFYRHHLMRNDANFSRLTPSEQRERVKKFMGSRESDNLKERYYERIPTIQRALGFQGAFWEGNEKISPDDWWNMRPRDLHEYTGLYQSRDERGSPLPMDHRAPVLEKKWQEQMGFPQDYGTEEQRKRAYEEWKANQQKDKGAFNQYMGSLNPIV